MTLKFVLFTVVIFCAVFSACSNPPLEKYFGIAVLNTNLLAGFGGEGLLRELQSPSVKLSGDDEVVTMKRIEVIDTKVQFIGETIDKLNDLKVTDDPVTAEMLRSSKDLYNFILPVYKNEYKELAKLYDDAVEPAQIETYAKSIHEKYFPEYKQLYDNLIRTGKVFADKHNIKVNWGVY